MTFHIILIWTFFVNSSKKWTWTPSMNISQNRWDNSRSSYQNVSYSQSNSFPSPQNVDYGGRNEEKLHIVSQIPSLAQTWNICTFPGVSNVFSDKIVDVQKINPRIWAAVFRGEFTIVIGTKIHMAIHSCQKEKYKSISSSQPFWWNKKTFSDWWLKWIKIRIWFQLSRTFKSKIFLRFLGFRWIF